MIRITTKQTRSHTVVTIDGRLAALDLGEMRRVRRSIGGRVVLKLDGLDACVDGGLRELRDWLDAGARLDTATLFLRMVLQDKSGSKKIRTF